MTVSPILAPSILNSNFVELAATVKLIEASQADWYHLDVMDGVFVPNISFGIPVIESIKKSSTKPLDVHLMIVEPDRHIEAFRRAGADLITVHLEACTHLHRTIEQILQSGAKAGVALNPHSPVDAIRDILEMVDLVLIMSVNPGFGGQKFIYQSIPKIKRLKEMIGESNSRAIIEVDGGIGLQNAESILQAGANALVVGNAIFGASDPMGVIDKLKAFSPNQLFV
jgi:ribulose-phosphate 3-epimerase